MSSPIEKIESLKITDLVARISLLGCLCRIPWLPHELSQDCREGCEDGKAVWLSIIWWSMITLVALIFIFLIQRCQSGRCYRPPRRTRTGWREIQRNHKKSQKLHEITETIGDASSIKENQNCLKEIQRCIYLQIYQNLLPFVREQGSIANIRWVKVTKQGER